VTRIWRPLQWRYSLKAYTYLPTTFIRRVVWGKDPYWKRYFWSRWGFLPADLLLAARAKKTIWIDALSGGEVTQLVTFCKMLRGLFPEYNIILSTNNRYSYEFAVARLGVDHVIDVPWDCLGPVRRALHAVSPLALVCVENVTSPVLVQEAKRMGILTLLVSGLMSKNVQLHPLSGRAMEMLPYRLVDWIGAKTGDDVDGFIALGANPSRTVVTGNMKFDLDYLCVPAEEQKRLCNELSINPKESVLLAASLHPGEEQLVGKAYVELTKTHPSLRLIVVPRYAFHADPMAETLGSLGLSCIKKTDLPNGRLRDRQVILVDTFGELSRLYSVASAVFIGGSTFLRNVVGFGQNIIEPLVNQKPLFFGTYMNLWKEITEDLRKEWPGVQVSSSEELASGLHEVFTDLGLRGRLEMKAAEIIGRHREDIRRNVEMVKLAISQHIN